MSARYVFDTAETTLYRFPTHANALVMDRADATASEVFISIMQPGEAPPMHVHHDTEQVFYVLEGEGRLEIEGESQGFVVRPGHVVRI
ncbi:MAG: cupin domain-containing protein, partial [Trueperaceae bacterium]